jgi:hypothetical protein
MPAVGRTAVTEALWRAHRALFRASGGRLAAQT